MSPEEFLVSDKDYLTISDFSSSEEITGFRLGTIDGIVDHVHKHDLETFCTEIPLTTESDKIETFTEEAKNSEYSCFIMITNSLNCGSHIDRLVMLLFLIKGLDRIPKTFRLIKDQDKFFVRSTLLKKVFKSDNMVKLTNESDPWNNPWINILSAFTKIKRIHDFQLITKETLAVFNHTINRLIRSEREPRRSNILKQAGLDSAAKIVREFSTANDYINQQQFILVDSVPANHPVFLFRMINPFTEKYLHYRTLLDLFEISESVEVKRSDLKKLTLITPKAVIERVKEFFHDLKRDEIEFSQRNNPYTVFNNS